MEIRAWIINLIKLSEKFLKTDMTYVLKNASWLMLGQAVSSILALAISIAFANILPMHEYGVYKFILSFVGIVAAFKLTGMGNAVTQAVSRGFDRTFPEIVTITLKWSIIPFLMYLSASGYYYYNGNLILSVSISLAGTLNLIVGSLGLYGSYLIGKQKFKLSTFYSIFTQLTNGTLILATVFITQNVIFLILANFLSTAILVTYFYFKTISSIDTNTTSNLSTISYGKHLSAINIFTVFASHLDKIIVFQLLGSIELAIYAFAIAIPEQVRGVYKSVLSIIVPKYANLSKQQLRYSVIKKSYTITLITLLIVVLYILAAPLIFQTLFPKYTESIIYSQIYALGLILTPSIFLLLTYFQIQQNTYMLYRVNNYANVIILILTVLFIYYFSLMGAALLHLASRFVMLSTCIYYFKKDSSEPG